jgi:hypothetical protein
MILRARQTAPVTYRVPRPRTAVLVGAAAFSVVMGFQGSFTWPSYVGVTAASLLVLWLGLRTGTRRLPSPRRLRRRAILAWSGPILAFSALEITDDALGSNAAHPTLSSLLDPVFEVPALRAVGVALWLFAGWQLAHR